MDKEQLKYTKEHEWLLIENDICTIGITDYAQGELGDIVFMELPSIGDNAKSEDSIGTIEAVKTVADVFSPVTGEINQINTLLEDTPELINTDPFGDGWIVKIKITSPDDTVELLSLKEYEDFIG